MKRTVINFLLIVFFIIFVYSGYSIIARLLEYKSSDDYYARLIEYVGRSETSNQLQKDRNAGSTSSETQAEQRSATDRSSDWPFVNFADLQAINQDIVGWIICKDTKINYPIVQGKDNSYYLNHHFNGKHNSAGCIFLDCRNNSQFSDTHNILYGHQVSDGSMFSAILKYKKQAFYDAHPKMILITPDANYQIDIFAGYVAKADESAWKLDFSSQLEYEEWLSEAVRRSTFKSQVLPTGEERIITLSTCSYEFYNARYVLVGILRWFPK